jgi:hypothetical protein
MCEFSVNSKDCPFLLKPGSATRVRSIPFSFHMCKLGLPASFTSTRGRAKLEYIVSTTTTGRRARDTTSNTFILLPYLAIRTFQTNQHNFNVDIENGGATTALVANIRNIITVLVNSGCVDVGRYLTRRDYCKDRCKMLQSHFRMIGLLFRMLI